MDFKRLEIPARSAGEEEMALRSYRRSVSLISERVFQDREVK